MQLLEYSWVFTHPEGNAREKGWILESILKGKYSSVSLNLVLSGCPF